MCGIGGILQFEDRPGLDVSLREMSRTLAHRGPDGEGCVVRDGRAGLFHRRLSIIDVGGGAQPMSNEDGTVWLTFNGEIYNFRELRSELAAHGHVFRTASDTEVVVHAYEEWGEACVSRLRGMFAFAIWDGRRGELMLARDRVGIKPLVYALTPHRIAFASELQALRASPGFDRTPDDRALDLYLHFQYIPAPLTGYRAAKKLPPGCTLVVDRDGQSTGPKRYWQLQFRPDENVSETEWCERLDHELRESVRCHTISDVPFGAFLSGGVDSSLVVAYMSEVLTAPVQTFSIGFDEAEFDETRYARQVAAQFHTTHYEERVKPHDLDVLPTLVRHYGEPFADSSALPTYYLSRMAAAKVKMVLSGDGGDEAFAGYSRYQHVLRSQIGPREPTRRARFAAGALLRKLGVRPRLLGPADAWFSAVSTFSEGERLSLWRPAFRKHVVETREWFDARYDETTQADLCSHLQRLDIDTYLPFDILTKVDIASMLSSLEVRVPLLDHRVLEMVATIPSRFKWRQGDLVRPDVGKYLLKQTAARSFSADFLNRPKRGFEVPIKSWFASTSKGWITERLLDAGSPLGEWFERAAIQRLIDEHGAGHAHQTKLWALVVLQEWLQQSKEAA